METSIDRLRLGKVNRRKSHFELFFGNGPAPIAVIGPPKARIVNVQFLGDPDDDVISKVLKEIKHYLLELGESDPWALCAVPLRNHREPLFRGTVVIR